LQLGFKLFNPALLGVPDRLRLGAVLEGSVAVLDELLLPAIELTGTDAQFIAEMGDRRLFDKVAPEGGYPYGAGKKMPRCLVYREPPFR
jgi:hypothetical protein